MNVLSFVALSLEFSPPWTPGFVVLSTPRPFHRVLCGSSVLQCPPEFLHRGIMFSWCCQNHGLSTVDMHRNAPGHSDVFQSMDS